MNAAPPSPATADLEPSTLARVRDLVHGTAGIVVSDRKGSMVRARLAKRLLATGHRDLDAYLDHVEGSAGAAELTQLIAAMTTNVTRFFREDHHFHALSAEVVPRWQTGQRIRSVWSAGCSTGQEPYSIAMTLKDAGLNRGTARILATDIDRVVLDRARCGSFLPREVADIPADLLKRHFHPTTDGWEAGPELRQLITFRALNLVGPWPFTGRFDAIFCRNVVIYFDLPTRARLWRRIVAVLRPGGRLFVGHSERLPEPLLGDTVTYLGRTMYQKSANAENE